MTTNSLIQNKPEENKRVLNVIKQELEKCDEFMMSVAFITTSGITPLLQVLHDTTAKGKIITTDYNYFTQPNAIKSLMKLENVEVRIYKSEEVAFHTKGYLFNEEGKYNILIGSSNLTANALMKNKEWNVYNTYNSDDKFTQDLLSTFNEYWTQSQKAENYIEEYTQLYQQNKPKYTVHHQNKVQAFKPNNMQQEFIKNFKQLLQKGEKRGLLISATGTGKTYASAFAIREAKPERLLFLVHREQIAKQALNTYKTVLEEDNFGLLTGNHHDKNAKYLFSTIQTMSKEETYTQFKQTEFDYIVIDEVHRAGAPSYQKIMQYFKPKFYLGMSASPDRTDDFDIYKLFHHNIIYEIRLKKALEENMLCDFHYFGINDPVDANNTSDEHVDKIIENLEYYKYSGNRVKGLIFCNTIENAETYSKKLNQRGYKTVSLSGKNTQEEREQAIQKLITNKENTEQLDYILTVDIFNEGVDIQEINQIVMLRPTESSIIFIQQLGRGLRKSKDKEYVVILDFISNYDNNYLIPVALSDDRTYNKDKMRKFIINIPHTTIGNSTINFDKIAKEKIYKSINDASLEKISFIREKYKTLKNKLNKTPTLNDFYDYDELDPMFIISYIKGKYTSYPELLPKIDKETEINLTKEQLLYLKFITTKLANGKRPHELTILKTLIQKQKYLINNDINYQHALTVLNKTFYKEKEQKEYQNIQFYEQKQNKITINKNFKKHLKNKQFKENIQDLITLGLKQYKDKYQHKNIRQDPFKHYQKYSRDDVVRLLNLKSNDSSTIYGYRTKKDINNNLHCPIFVTYNKKETISKTTQYKDKFINKQQFNWMTRSNLKIQSKEVQQIINHSGNGNQFYLFIKKSDDEGNEFYYIGQATPTQPKQTTIQNDKGQHKPIVNFQLQLKQTIRQDIYDYITN